MTSDSEEHILKVPLGVNNIKMLADTKITLLGMSFSPGLYCTADNLEISAIGILKRTSSRPNVLELKVRKLEGLTITFMRVRVFGWLINLLTRAAANLFKGTIITFVESTLQSTVTRGIQNVDLLLNS